VPGLPPAVLVTAKQLIQTCSFSFLCRQNEKEPPLCGISASYLYRRSQKEKSSSLQRCPEAVYRQPKFDKLDTLKQCQIFIGCL
jgi:hypothetical protein